MTTAATIDMDDIDYWEPIAATVTMITTVVAVAVAVVVVRAEMMMVIATVML